MKRKSIIRLATVFLSLFLVCICLATVFAFPLKASAAGNYYSGSVNINNSTTIGITNKKTTIQIINTNNYLLKEAKKENGVLKKVRNEGKDWVNDAFALVNAIKNSSGEDVDWEKIGVEATKNIITSIAGIWGFDGVAGAVLDGIESLITSGQAPLSEVQVLSDDIDKRFNAISDQLYDIEDQLGALSNQVTSSANDVLSGTQTQINNLEAKQILRSFMSSGEGNFSYLEYSNYLYGNKSNSVNASEAYYILLLEAIQSGASDEVVEYYYNKLFESVYTNIAIYNQYYYGEIAGLDKSMAAYYYDYLSYNPNLVDDGTSAEYQALLFALDLYTTYVYSYEILEMCFAYQATNMYLDASLENRNISGIDTYEYADGKLIMYSTIQAELVDMQANLVLAEEQIAEDIAYILGMKDSYLAVDDNGNVHSIGNYGESFGNVANGQTVYLNIVPDEICELFTLNADKFRYYVNGAEYTGANKAIVDVNEVHNDTFTASVTYGNTEIYNIEFTKIDSINENSQKTPIYEFSGGSGTLDDPYLISNALQFYMVWDNLDASYQLISDIVVTGTHSPIGTEKKPFNGTFDGNGYFISGLSVESLAYDSTNTTMNPTTGMFGTIGRNGVVKNLTLKGMSVVSDYEKDAVKPENDNSYYCIGGIAGTNRGTISNCTITENSSITVNRSKQAQDSRNVSVYVGGIVGSNSGVIEYCSVDSLSINATSYHYYYNESVSKNEHTLYVGGVAAITNNTIQNCRVSENTKISAYAKSIADSEDREKPMLTVYVGGIIADDAALQYISNVYSNCNIVKCQGDIYNEGTYWGSHRYSWDNVTVKKGLYYPTFLPLSASETVDEYEMNFYSSEYLSIYNKNYAAKSDEVYLTEDRGLTVQEIQEVALASSKELKAKIVSDETKANTDALAALGNKIISTYDNAIFALDTQKTNVSIELANNVCDINAKYLTEYFDKLIDEENKVKNIKFVDASGKKVDATVVGYYGFNTYHEYTTAQTITVKVFFYVDDTLMNDDVTLVVRANELVDWKIEDFVTTFDKGVSSSACYDEIFEHGFKLKYIFSNGKIEEYVINAENKEDIVISGFSTTEAGEKEVEIIHLKQPAVGSVLKFKENIFVKCPHTDNDFEHISTVSASCSSLGYEIWECQLCGETANKNYKKGFHNYIISDGVEATCHEAGYTQEVSCSICGEVFESSEWIQALPHYYVSSSDGGYKANGLYPATEYHYCINGDHYEAHQYTVSEYVDENGTLVYLYSCFCGYENPVPDYNIKTKENGEKPVVVVTSGHVLNVGDEVVVYVQIINNPGFKGATFGIRYDNGLELISADESMIVPQQLKVRNEVYNGYNFLWAEGDGNKTTEDGYLLKLTFKYIDETEGEQHISVVYGMSNGSEGGFCTLDDGYHMFMTQSGTISVVDHLPGDVNNDDVVDIMDATFIAWSIVGKEGENGNKVQVNAKYADVNLDGKVDLLDVLAILQSISGRYGTSLLSSDYKLFFDLNGFICDDIDESVMVEFYDENGNRTKWSENVDFAKYEALMKHLGYSFVGWYTRMNCACVDTCTHIVEATDFITYDKYQGNQTLYARWERNRIVFDINGCDAEPIDDILYGSRYEDNSIITLPELTWSYDVTCIAFGTEENTKYTGRIYRTFIGWEDENGNIITQIDILQPGLGVVNLKAKWSESYVWDAPIFAVNGYEIRNWYLDTYYTEDITEDTSWVDFVSALKENNFYVYSKKIATKYTISYENTKDAANYNLSEYTIESPKIVLSDIIVDGYIFGGWYDGDKKITEIPKYSFGDIVLTARWTPIAYTITYENAKGATNPNNQNTYTIEDEVAFENLSDIDGYVFKGWYTAEHGGTKIISIEKGCIGNKVYYAQWTPIVYTITYENTKGVTNSNNPITYTIEDEVIFESLSNVEGYAFNAWYTENGMKANSIAIGSTGDKVYYAEWTKNGYSIKYNLDGGINDRANPNAYTIESETITFATPTRTGYTFGGWYTDSGFTQVITEIKAGSYGNVELYAKWNVIEYTISYNLNGGSTNESNIDKYTIEKLPITIKNPQKDGYRFIGWSGTGIEGITDYLVIDSIGNKIYEANYEAIVYNITYKYEVIRDGIYYPLDDVTNAVDNPSTYTIETSTIKLDVPTKKGYTFIGWIEGNEIPNGSTADKTFTAKFKPTPYTITWKFAGGTGNGEYPTSYTIESGDITVENPTRVGYTFKGWIGTGIDEPIMTIMILNGSTGDESYTATWGANTYFVTYKYNPSTGVYVTENEEILKGSFATNNLLNGVTYETNCSLGTAKATTYEEYYEFLGWYSESGIQVTDSDGNPKTNISGYTDSSGNWCFTRTITLVAHYKQWKEEFIYITEVEEFLKIEYNLAGKYMLLKDITLGSTTPIGTYYWTHVVSDKADDNASITPFKGVLDGQGHTITYSMNFTSFDTTSAYSIGLFATSDGATFKNIKLNAKVIAQGKCENGFCAVEVSVGGLVGTARNTTFDEITILSGSKIENNETDRFHTNFWGTWCYCGALYAGGVVGDARGCSFNECNNYATVYAQGFTVYAGGIAGNAYNSTQTTNCVNYGNVSSAITSTYPAGECSDNNVVFGKTTAPWLRKDGETQLNW